MIRKLKSGYRVVARSGRNMGTYSLTPTGKKKAQKRLRQIERFSKRKK